MGLNFGTADGTIRRERTSEQPGGSTRQTALRNFRQHHPAGRATVRREHRTSTTPPGQLAGRYGTEGARPRPDAGQGPSPRPIARQDKGPSSLCGARADWAASRPGRADLLGMPALPEKRASGDASPHARCVRRCAPHALDNEFYPPGMPSPAMTQRTQSAHPRVRSHPRTRTTLSTCSGRVTYAPRGVRRNHWS